MRLFDMAGATDRGRVRKNNEDSFIYHLIETQNIALAVVADGVGGYEGGEVASQLSVEGIKNFIVQQVEKENDLNLSDSGLLKKILLQALEKTNKEILRQQKLHLQLNKMASTVVAVLCCQDQLYLTHYGDSRCYLWRDNKLEQLTTDHSVAEQMLAQGFLTKENMHLSPYHHAIYHALGLAGNMQAEVVQLNIQQGDLFLLCSDGLNNCLSDEKIASIIKNEADIKKCTDRLLTQSNAAGGVDNITALLLSCEDQ